MRTLIAVSLLWLSAPVFANLNCPYDKLVALDSIPARIKYGYEVPYYFSKSEQETRKVLVKDGLLVRNNGQMVTTHTGRGELNREMPEEKNKSAMVIAENGDLFIIKKSDEGKIHHSTPVRGNPVKFAAEIAIDENHKVYWLSYRSGHYPHGPYRLKLFMESLKAQGVSLDGVTVELSDRHFSERTGRYPVPADFFLSVKMNEKTTGHDVALQYLMATPAQSFADGISDFIKKSDAVNERFADIRYFLTDGAPTVERAISEGMSREEIQNKFSDWIKVYRIQQPSLAGQDIKEIANGLKARLASRPSDWRQFMLQLNP